MNDFNDVVGGVKKFSANVLANERPTTPVKVQILDVGMTPVYEMEATLNDSEAWIFSDRPIAATIWKPGPYTVRFTPQGRAPFDRPLPTTPIGS